MLKKIFDKLCKSRFYTIKDAKTLSKDPLKEELLVYALQTYIVHIKNKDAAEDHIRKTMSSSIYGRNVCLNLIDDEVDLEEFIRVFQEKCIESIPNIIKAIADQERYYNSPDTIDDEHIAMPTSLIMSEFAKSGGQLSIVGVRPGGLFEAVATFKESPRSYRFQSDHYAYAVLMATLKAMQ